MKVYEEVNETASELLRYIVDFAADNEWEAKVSQQLKAFFTTWCFIYHVDADTNICDNALRIIYEKIAEKSEISREAFENFMLELVV